MTEIRVFPAMAASVPEVRAYVADLLGPADDAALNVILVLASELATNAVVHAGTEFEVRVSMQRGRVRVEVRDHGRGVPRRRQPPPSEPHGRGLLVVDKLADEWGVVPAPDGHGSTVWFVAPLAQASAV